MQSPAFHPPFNRLLAGCGIAPRHVTTCDSAATFPGALAAFLRGEDFAVTGRTRLRRAAAHAALCALPEVGTAFAMRVGTWAAALPPSAMKTFRSETIARWTTSGYPRRRFPVLFLGAANGAAVHLAAAVGAPWLPQTYLVLARASRLDPEDPPSALRVGRELARPLLAAAPDFELQQVQAPPRRAGRKHQLLHFHLKRLELGPSYERFVLQHLQPGGTLVIVDCQSPRACVQVDERHYVQLADAGLPEVAHQPSAQPLGTRPDTTSSPHPEQMTRPEARWGYEPRLTADVARFADRHGYRLERISFQEPEHLSPWVADLYRERVVLGCGAPDRLVVESAAVTDPWCMQRTGSVPYWVASTESSGAAAVDRYLDHTRAFEEIRAVPLSRCPWEMPQAADTESAERWRIILRRALGTSAFLGASVEDPPQDARVLLSYHDAWLRVPDAPRRPRLLTWSEVRAHAEGNESPVRLELLQD